MHTIGTKDEISRHLSFRTGSHILKLHRDPALVGVVQNSCDTLARAIFDLSISLMGLGSHRYRRRYHAVEVGAQHIVQTTPVAHLVMPRPVDNAGAFPPGRADELRGDSCWSAGRIVFVEQGDDTGTDVDAGLVAMSLFARVLLQDEDFASLTFELEPLEQACNGATDLKID